MDKIFCLGELYDKEDKELIDYKLNNATEYEQMKNTYVNEIYKNNNSKITVYNLYRKNILNREKILNKDLIYFIYKLSLTYSVSLCIFLKPLILPSK